MQLADTLFLIAVIVFSAIIHEVMHGVAADKLGDPTARYAGRLTLNPFPHIDLFGSILLPAMLALSHSPLFFAWAKPVPYNPFNLRAGRFSEAMVAFAGPLSNAVIALISALLIRSGALAQINDILLIIVIVNVMLFFFNLIPIPPLDGSKVLQPFLPGPLGRGYEEWRTRMEQNPFLGMGLIVIVILLMGNTFGRFIYGIANAVAGV